MVSITDTIKFHHQYLTQPGLTPTDRLIHAIHTLTVAIHYTPEVNSEQQLLAIYHMRRLFHTWRDTSTTTSPNPKDIPTLTLSAVTRPPKEPPVEKPSTHPQKFPET